MLRVLDNRDERLMRWIQANDPFQLSEPSWLVRVLNKLPGQLVELSIEEKTMAIKQVEEKFAPVRLFKRSGIASSPEFYEVINALKGTPKDRALVVTLESAEFTGANAKKPEVSFAGTLRRYFQKNGIMGTAYASGKLEVTVKHADAPPKTNKKKK